MDYGGSGLFLLLGTKRNNLKQRKENMERMKKKKMVAIAFSFLLITFPLQVFAAGSDLTKEITLTVKNEADSRELAEKEFPETWKEGGKTYERSEITYKLVETKYLDKKEKEMELKSEPEQTFTEGKTVYTLKKTEKVEKSIAEGDVQTVTAYDDYDYAIAESDVPATKTVTVDFTLTVYNFCRCFFLSAVFCHSSRDFCISSRRVIIFISFFRQICQNGCKVNPIIVF